MNKDKVGDTPSEDSNYPSFDERRVTHTWLSGNLSATLVIPIEIARRNGLDKPSNVVVEETKNGILIRKLRNTNKIR